LTLAEASKEYGVPPTTLRNAIHRQQLSGTLIGKTWIVKRDDLLAFLKQLRPRPSRRKHP